MWKALLIDDEANIRTLLKTVLEMADFAVETASSAHSAIECLRSQTYDVVISDLRMETQFAGYDVARIASRLDPRPVVVIVTAFPVPPSEWRSVGADALFTKGTDTLQLASRLVQILEKQASAADRKPTAKSGSNISRW
jgi:DNA-binding NtrC family response regulator